MSPRIVAQYRQARRQPGPHRVRPEPGQERPPSGGDRGFGSCFLHQRVTCEPGSSIRAASPRASRAASSRGYCSGKRSIGLNFGNRRILFKTPARSVGIRMPRRNFKIAADDDSLPVIVPRNDKAVVPISSERVTRLRKHLVLTLRALRRMKNPEHSVAW